MISDGCGYPHVDAASMYQYGAPGTQPYERFPVKCAVTTYPADTQEPDSLTSTGYDPHQAWSRFDYVMDHWTDSAEAATAMSTGVKTRSGAIGVGVDRKPLRHVAQVAHDLGKATGVVTTVPMSHATPAGFVAHNASRQNYDEIAREMLLDSPCTVIMGCGHPLFDANGAARSALPSDYRYVGGQRVWEGLCAGDQAFDLDGDGTPDKTVQDVDGDAVPDPWTLVQTRAQFRALVAGPTPKRVLGVPQVWQTLQCDRVGQAGSPYGVPFLDTVPTLAAMTAAALNVMDNHPGGFFLMVEGGAADWASHNNNSVRLVEEQADFNRSVHAVIQWVQEHSSWRETLVVVTSDHECGYLTGPGSGPPPDGATPDALPVWNPLENHGPRRLPGMEWHSASHTNSLVPLFAKGPGSSRFQTRTRGTDPMRGPYVDDTDIARVLRAALGVPPQE